MAKLGFDANKLNSDEKILYDSMIAKRKGQGADFGGPYVALMNHPELCQKIEELGFYLKFQGHLPRDVYQFIVLSVAKYTKSNFEWQNHMKHALNSGMPQSLIDVLKTKGIQNQEFPDPYRLAALILQSTLTWQNIPEHIQQEAIAFYGIQGFIEIVVLSGFYQMFSAINQGFDIQ